MTLTVIRNLINNAIKFSSKNDQIIISSKPTDDNFVEVSVRDRGMGIKKKDLLKLFKIDEQLKTKGTVGETGTGLGLILCMEFVEKNGGKIWAESEEGKGSTFIFTLPKG